MKKLLVIVLTLAMAATMMAGVSSMATKLPKNAETVVVIEDLKANYEKMKTSTFLDFFLEQLAVEILIQQYFEMIVYNSGSRPSDIYPAISADFGFATWYAPESSALYSIIVLGPMDRPSSARTALRNVLPQFLSPQDIPEIVVDGKYLYVGDVSKFASVDKGFSSDRLTEGFPGSFGYFYAANNEMIQRGAARVERDQIILEGYIEGRTDETRSLIRMIPREEGTLELERMEHYALVSGVLAVNEPFVFEDLIGLGLDFSTRIPGVDDLEMDEVVSQSLAILNEITGRAMLDFSVPVEDIFSALFSLQPQAEVDIDVPSFDLLVRLEFSGDLSDLTQLFEATDIEYSETDGLLRLEDGQHLWIQDGWIFLSNSRKAITSERLESSRSAFESLNYASLARSIPQERFAVMFVDTGLFLGGLLGTGQIQSGMLASAWYSPDTERIEFLVILD